MNWQVQVRFEAQVLQNARFAFQNYVLRFNTYVLSTYAEEVARTSQSFEKLSKPLRRSVCFSDVCTQLVELPHGTVKPKNKK